MNKKLLPLACVICGAVWTVAVPAVASIAVPGNFNGDTWINHEDIDLLAAAAHSGLNDPLFDLNGDGFVTFAIGPSGSLDFSDSDALIRDILGTEYGDADLDGDVFLADLVALATHYRQSGEFGWAEGNFDGSQGPGSIADPRVSLSDLIALAMNWRFEGDGGAIELDPGAPPSGANPEPVSGLVWLIGACLSYSFANRRGKRVV